MLQTDDNQMIKAKDVKGIPASTRRRLNNFGLHAAQLAFDKIENEPLIVFASRYGDVERSLRILGEISQGEPLSPMNFSLSVHNAVPGVLSIAWKLTEMQSVISAGRDTFVMGLTEAFSLLKSHPQKPVLFLYLDLPLPSVFSEFENSQEKIGACALLLHSGDRVGEGPIFQAAFNHVDNLRSQGEEHPVYSLYRMLEGEIDQLVIGAGGFFWRLDAKNA
ncbi:MAG: beta-ketoacyl synthase chain length factor [Sneathiella sp.]